MEDGIDQVITDRSPDSTVSLGIAPGHVTPMRGAVAASTSRGFWIKFGWTALVLFAISILIGFFAVSIDNARMERIKSHGIPVTVTVTNCVGNIGGSGSNAAGYSCHGHYRLDRVTYNEAIGSMTNFAPADSSVRGVVDPSNHGTVELWSAAQNSKVSSTPYVTLTLLCLVLLFLSTALYRKSRMSEVSHGVD